MTSTWRRRGWLDVSFLIPNLRVLFLAEERADYQEPMRELCLIRICAAQTATELCSATAAGAPMATSRPAECRPVLSILRAPPRERRAQHARRRIFRANQGAHATTVAGKRHRLSLAPPHLQDPTA